MLATVLRQAAAARQRRRSKPPRVPLARQPAAARIAYLSGLLELQRIVEAAIARDLLPLLPSVLGQHKASRPDSAAIRIDMTGTLTDDAVDRINTELQRVIPERRIRLLAQDNALRVADHAGKQLQRQVNAVAKVDLFAGDQGLAEHIDAFVSDNVRLVKSLTFDQLEDLKGIVLRGARQGERVETVQRQIQERFGLSRKRAARIARDQVGKLNGEVAQLRQQRLGVRRYRWSTSKDERVRPGHRRLEGTIQDWTKPPIVDEKSGRRAHPGQDVQCRCQPIPVVEDLLVDAGLLAPDQIAVTPSPRPQLRVAPPLPAQAPTAWMRGAMEVVNDEPIGRGVNAARAITVKTPDGRKRRAVWKDADSEQSGLRRGVKAGTYHEREAAVYELDQELGGDGVVPPTVSRSLRGKRGSMQEFVPGAQSTQDVAEELSARGMDNLAADPSLRRTFLLDVITANDDRHAGNVLWRRGRGGALRAVAIDNGLALPDGGPGRFLFAVPRSVDFARAMLELDAESIRQLGTLKLERVAAILRRYPGITSRQIRETLGRIKALQNDPQQLERLSKGKQPADFMHTWLSIRPEERAGLSGQDLAEIDRIVEKGRAK